MTLTCTNGTFGIIVHSRNSIRLADPRKPFLVISVTDPFSHFAPVPSVSPYCAGILQLKFHDIQQPVANLTPFTDRHAQVILDFVVAHLDSIELILCNCDAGISRSPAIAAALANIFCTGQEDEIWKNAGFNPNLFVYNQLTSAYTIR